MKITCSQENFKQLTADVCTLLCEEGKLEANPTLHALDQALGGILYQVIKEEQFQGKKGQSLLLHTHGKIPSHRILLLGMGASAQAQASLWHLWSSRVVKISQSVGAKRVGWILPDTTSSQVEIFQWIAEGIHLSAYSFARYLGPERKSSSSLDEVLLLLPKSSLGKEIEASVHRGEVIAGVTQQARDWTNEPPCVMSPAYFVALAQEIAAQKSLSCKVLTKEECKQHGMNLVLAVGQGSSFEPFVLHLTYKPAAASGKIYALIGKGVTFDSGGLAIKTLEGMVDMKADMAGAAVALGTMAALSELQCPHEVHAVIPLVENMVSGRSYRPGDIYRAMNGKTVEINNPDAEGRLIMADAMCYAAKFIKPSEMIDFATLTGACLIALGPYVAGVMSNDAERVKHFLAAAQNSGEDMWPLPLPERLREYLKSDVADIRNSGGVRLGGALTAGHFLKEFAQGIPWIHVDIAGPAFMDKEYAHYARGGTGFGIATLLQYLTPRATG